MYCRSFVFVVFVVSRFFRHLVLRDEKVKQNFKKNQIRPPFRLLRLLVLPPLFLRVLLVLLLQPVRRLWFLRAPTPLAHFGVQGSVVAGVTGQFTVPSSTAGGVAGPPLVGCPDTVAYFSGPQCMTGQFTVPSSATPAQGRATGLLPFGGIPLQRLPWVSG